MRIIFLFVFIISGTVSVSQGQIWNASWIEAPETNPHEYGVYDFLKTFVNVDPGANFEVAVSADNRYILYINDIQVSSGPARSDLYHWKYHRINLKPYLKPGRNTIRARVWNFGSYSPEAQISYRTAFILEGLTPVAKILNTNSSWRCRKDERYQPLLPDLIYTYYAAGPGDYVNFRTTINNDTSKWSKANVIAKGVPKGAFDWSTGWMLVENKLPEMESLPLSSPVIIQTDINGQKVDNLQSLENLIIKPNSTLQILLDQQQLVNGFPAISISGGKEAIVSMRYAEALYKMEGTNDWKSERSKGNRNEISGKRFVGTADAFECNGDFLSFSPLVWRTWRYLHLEIKTGSQPLTIHSFSAKSIGYPFQRNTTFTSNNPHHQQLLDVGWHTARLCAVETYMDCPYYEQLQYAGDTRIQGLVSFYMGADDRLWRNAIEQINYSRLAEGLTLSRFPTRNHQEIPPFSLIWILMVHDYWWYRPDHVFVEKQLQGVRDVLQFFNGLQDSNGSLTNVPYWNFVDWAEGPDWNAGIPPMGEGKSALLDMQLLMALQAAAALEGSVGKKANETLYLAAALKLKSTIRSLYLDRETGLFKDTPSGKTRSQHAQALAIISGTATKSEYETLSNAILHNEKLTKATIYFKFYIHQALTMAGKGNLYEDLLNDWEIQLQNGLTTWAEISDVNNARSDCHAWGSSPNIEFIRTVAGINSNAPGFNSILIKPHPGNLTSIEASMPHSLGVIQVQMKKNKSWNFQINLPSGLNGTFEWNGKSFPLKGGKNEFTF